MEGNLMQLLQIHSKDLAQLKRWIKDRRYMSPVIINELITLMGNSVLRSVLADVKESTWYSIIADEVTDINCKEQFNISVRYVNDNYEVFEDPLGFFEVPSINSETLFKALSDVLIRCTLPISLCRGQAYDGASNMQGHRTGLAT